MKKLFLGAMLCLVSATFIFAQKSQENSILWKVTGKDLQKASYLFGTYHFLTNAFVDTLPGVLNAYKSSKVVVGELIIDSTIQGPMMAASVLNGTTLKKVLPDTLYAKTSKWFKEEANLDLIKLDQLNPITIMTAAMAITKQKHFPSKPGEIQLDTYFQQKGIEDGKKILGLETIEIQINALFNQLSLDRQIELLNETLNEKDGLRSAIAVMNDAYLRNDLKGLHDLMYGSNYKPAEMKALLDDRNNHWMQQLPTLMKEQPLFVAVGALHLVGQTGLVSQLRKQGYTVTPVNLKN